MVELGISDFPNGGCTNSEIDLLQIADSSECGSAQDERPIAIQKLEIS